LELFFRLFSEPYLALRLRFVIADNLRCAVVSSVQRQDSPLQLQTLCTRNRISV